ncbi:MAG: type II toxin-antitoxin system HicB family antitoxin [Planctomycetota bacterium]|nr:type II toxin-antitoxin system HicB family antitoxin [Planctomycetota bacterium]
MPETTHQYRGYVFTIRYVAKDPAYTVEFPDIPEIITSGDTLALAFEHACEALDLHLESLLKLGRHLPPKRTKLIVKTA